jgi:hypothetical protein
MKWVKNLLISENETIEQRIRTILEYIFTTYASDGGLVMDIDATGKFGDRLTRRINNKEEIRLSKDEILSLVNEDGQIIELNLLIDSPPKFQILVIDGNDIDIIGDEELPVEVLGKHSDGDLTQYLIDQSDER